LFEGPGVLNWKSGIEKESQNPDSVSRLIEDVSKFGIPVYIVEEDLRSYGLDHDNLVSNPPKLISREEAAVMIFHHETTMAV
jgi:hypothetical protein